MSHLSMPASTLDSNTDFRRLWLGQTVSLIGSQLSVLALPLVAVLSLHANAEQMGWLTAITFLPFLLFGLVAGALLDRLPKRPVLMAADAGRAIAFSVIPMLALRGVLRMEHLYVFGFLSGTCTMFFMLAYTAILPALVGKEELTQANGRLHASQAAAQAAGPSLAGILIQGIGAATTLFLDAASYVFSVVMVASIRARETAHESAGARPGIIVEVREGVHYLFRHTILRALTIVLLVINVCASGLMAIYVLYVSRDLAISPSVLGLIMATAGVCGVAGAVAAQRLAGRIGVGRTIAAGSLVAALGGLVMAAPAGAGPGAVVSQFVAQGLVGFGIPLIAVTGITLMQTLAPPNLQARVIGTMRFVTWGVMPLGAASAGALGTRIGLRGTVAIASVGIGTAALCVLMTPLRQLRGPQVAAAPAAVANEDLRGADIVREQV